MGSEKSSRVHTKRREWLQLDFGAISQRWRWIYHIVCVTCDESWVSFLNAAKNEQSKQWINTNSPNKPEQPKRLPARKLIATVFWDRKEALVVKFMQQGTTITSEMYCETLKLLFKTIKNKRRGMLTYGLVLLHDNSLF
jgi:hypothetical protein